MVHFGKGVSKSGNNNGSTVTRDRVIIPCPQFDDVEEICSPAKSTDLHNHIYTYKNIDVDRTYDWCAINLLNSSNTIEKRSALFLL